MHSQTNIQPSNLFFACIHSYKPIVDYIDTQFENYLQEELKIKRSLFNYHDTRIHICLYFISPTGHSLKSLDLVTMKKLDSKVGRADAHLHRRRAVSTPPPLRWSGVDFTPEDT